MDPLTIAKQFSDFYYLTFDGNRAALSTLYRDDSMLTWESEQIPGVNKIVEKLEGLPFQQVQHKVSTCDAQPSGAHGGIIVFITGLLLVDGGETPLQFSQVFQLKPEGGAYYVYNDIFRLNYG